MFMYAAQLLPNLDIMKKIHNQNSKQTKTVKDMVHMYIKYIYTFIHTYAIHRHICTHMYPYVYSIYT